jgi:F-type H+-transporting ATPase subunit delta
MSRSTVVVKRYAKALFELAREQGRIAETESELKLVVDAIQGSEEFRAFLSAPGIAVRSKIQTLANAFGDHISPLVRNTISLLIERGRQDGLTSLLDAYAQVASGALGRVEAQVASAKPLTEAEREKLAAKFGELLGKTVRVNNTVDPSLLGGLTVRIGDTLYDGSLRGKLERLEKTLQTSAN